MLHRRIPLLLVGLVAVLAVGCGNEGRPVVGAASPAEDRRWLERLGTWIADEQSREARFIDAYNALLGDVSRRADYERALDGLRACARRFVEQVDDPPGRRFRAGAALMRQACMAGDAATRARKEALDDPTKLVEVDRHDLAASEGFVKADSAIQRELAANRRLPRVFRPSSSSRIEGTLSRLATRLAGRTVEVRCWSASEWKRVKGEWAAYAAALDVAGFASVDLSAAHLEPEVCGRVVEFVYGRRAVPSNPEEQHDLALAIGVLAHEVEHISSDRRGEQAVECFAMQRLDLFARALGAPAGEARTLASVYAADVYPELPPEYRSDERCRDGGELDLDPASSVWP